MHRLQGDVVRRAPGDKMSYGFNSPELERRLARLVSPPLRNPDSKLARSRSAGPSELGGPYRTRSRSRFIKWLAVALIAVGMVVAGAGVINLLSNQAAHTGFLEDHPLIFLPDLNQPSCGKACAYMTVFQGETTAFNFTVLNRVVKQYNYSINFDLQTQNVNITFFIGQFFSISQDGTHTKTPLTVTWTGQNETSAQGVVYGLHILEEENQWYSLELTMSWSYQAGFLDGAYLLTYWASPA